MIALLLIESLMIKMALKVAFIEIVMVSITDVIIYIRKLLHILLPIIVFLRLINTDSARKLILEIILGIKFEVWRLVK